MKNVFIWGLLLGFCGLILLFYAHRIEPNRLLIRHVKLTSAKGKNCRIVQFTDTHMKKNITPSQLRKLVQKINALKPDVLVFTGDLVDCYKRYPEITDKIQASLSKLQATYGKFAIFGNHEYGGDMDTIYPAFMNSCGFQVLCNTSYSIEKLKLTITGLDDVCNRDIPSTIAYTNYFRLLLIHEPDIVQRYTDAPIDLVLSGHTHGGQVYIPFLAPLFKHIILPKYGRLYRKGLYEVGQMKLYVSSGIGTTKLPLRFLNPPEVICIDLQEK